MSNHRMRLAGRTATGLIGAMFVGTYAGSSHSRGGTPAALVGTAVIANVAAQHGDGRRLPSGLFSVVSLN